MKAKTSNFCVFKVSMEFKAQVRGVLGLAGGAAYSAHLPVNKNFKEIMESYGFSGKAMEEFAEFNYVFSYLPLSNEKVRSVQWKSWQLIEFLDDMNQVYEYLNGLDFPIEGIKHFNLCIYLFKAFGSIRVKAAAKKAPKKIEVIR